MFCSSTSWQGPESQSLLSSACTGYTLVTEPVTREIQPLHKPVILTSTVKGITVNKGHGFLKAWPRSTVNTAVEEQEEHGHVGQRGGGDTDDLCHPRCSFFMWTSSAQQYCLRRGMSMEQESIIQPGISIFSCLILPLLLDNFSWHTLFTLRTGHCKDRVKA